MHILVGHSGRGNTVCIPPLFRRSHDHTGTDEDPLESMQDVLDTYVVTGRRF